MKPPRARRDDLLMTQLDDEVVVYDPETKRAHSLNRVAVAVWSHCDGIKTIEELRRQASDEIGAPIDQTAVMLALQKLERAHLLIAKIGTASSLSRREVLVKAGQTALVTPLVASALIPVAAAAQSPAECLAGVSCPTTVCAQAPNGTTCYCFTTFEDVGVCGGDYTCTIPCTSSAECEAEAGVGWTCRFDTCCGNGYCGPPCGSGLSPNQNANRPSQARQGL